MTVKDLLDVIENSADILIVERRVTRDCPIDSDDLYADEPCTHDYRLENNGVIEIGTEACKYYDAETESCILGLEEHWDYTIAYFGRADEAPIKLADAEVLCAKPYTHETHGKANKKILTNVIRIEVE